MLFLNSMYSLLEPPSAPQNLSVNFVDQSTVALSWSPPDNLGGRADIRYRIKCDACSLGLVQYNPHSVTPQDEILVSIFHMSIVCFRKRSTILALQFRV